MSLESAKRASSLSDPVRFQIVHAFTTGRSSSALRADKSRVCGRLATHGTRKPYLVGGHCPRRYYHRMGQRWSSIEWPPSRSSGWSSGRTLSIWRTMSIWRTLSSRLTLSKGRRTPPQGWYSGSPIGPNGSRGISVRLRQVLRRGGRNYILLCWWWCCCCC